MIHVDPYEKLWIYVAAAMLLIFGAAITVSAFATGIQLPSPEMRVDPRLVATPGATSFGEPGLRELAPGKFEARMLAQTWSFKPNEIKVKAGSKITFYVTSKDVIHGFHIDETNVNFMVIPGQVSKLSHTFDKPGTYNIICHEYCGIGHQTMFAQVIVEP